MSRATAPAVIDNDAPESVLSLIDAACGIRSPREPGLTIVGTSRGDEHRRVVGVHRDGGNLSPTRHPTSAYLVWLRACDLTVHVSTKLNRSHLVHGRRALILPCLARSERASRPGACSPTSSRI